MVMTPTEGVFLDIEAMELADGCISSTVPIYIMAQYAKNVEKDPILSESYLEKLSKKMLDNWTEIVHNYKQLISEQDLLKAEFNGEYPKNTQMGIDHLRYVYYGYRRKNHPVN